MKKKPCSICHLPKPLSQFNKDSSLKSGLSPYCRTCSKIKWLEYKTRRGITKVGGFTNEDASPVRLSPEERFVDAYSFSDVELKGKLVMKKGVVVDDKWYQKKLKRFAKRFKLTNIPSTID